MADISPGVIERHAVLHTVALSWMVRHLLSNAAGSFSVNKFHGDLRAQGIPVAKDTLHDYLGYLEDAFLIRTVSLATESERRGMADPPVSPGARRLPGCSRINHWKAVDA